MKVFLIHARNQLRTVWLMTAARFNAPYDIQTHSPALRLSVYALILGYLITGIYDYLNYPNDLLEGYVDEGVSRYAYVIGYQITHLVGTLTGYLLLFALAIPLGFDKRYWHGIIAFNWWTFVIGFAFLPLLLMLHAVDNDDDVSASILTGFLLIALAVFVWKSINLFKNAFRTGIGMAIALGMLSLVIEITVSGFVAGIFGMRLF